MERGKTLVSPQLGKGELSKIGWIPSNAYITCFGDLALAEAPEIGDVFLTPSGEGPISLARTQINLDTQLQLCDIRKLDNKPWQCCLRNQLQEAVNRLKSLYQIELVIGMEQEFYVLNSGRDHLNAYSIQSFFEEEDFLQNCAEVMLQAGINLHSFHSENGISQYEVTFGINPPLMAADQMVLAKIIIKLCAIKMNKKITFSPIISDVAVGSGLHIHFSLKDKRGRNINASHNAPVSTEAGAFVAGILKHLRSLLAFTSPSAISPLRYRPPRWSAYYDNFALQDRKAAIRLVKTGGRHEESHFEFRTADATASPYLVLSAIINAGMMGLKNKLQTPQLRQTKDISENHQEGINRLPGTLAESHDHLVHDHDLTEFYPQGFIHAYLSNRCHELKFSESLKESERYQKYSNCY